MGRERHALWAGVIAACFAAAPVRAGELWVSSEKTDEVLRFDSETGEPLGVVASGGGLWGPEGLALTPDGELIVSSYYADEVLRFDLASGASNVLIGGEDNGVSGPVGLGIGSDGLLYVGDRFTHSIRRYDLTGAFVDTFATGMLSWPDAFTWGPQGDLYVSSRQTSEVERFDGVTGASKGFFVSGGDLDTPDGLRFGPDGDLYVTSRNDDRILRYDGATGAFVSVFAQEGLSQPFDFVFRGDTVFVTNVAGHDIARLDANTGAYIDAIVAPQAGGLNTPTFLLFRPVCGDGIVDAPEACDDGDTVGGDGCSATCDVESDTTVTTSSSSSASSVSSAVSSSSSSGAGGAPGSGGAGGDAPESGYWLVEGPGCGCHVPGGKPRPEGLLALLGLVGLWGWRRRR